MQSYWQKPSSRNPPPPVKPVAASSYINAYIFTPLMALCGFYCWWAALSNWPLLPRVPGGDEVNAPCFCSYLVWSGPVALGWKVEEGQPASCEDSPGFLLVEEAWSRITKTGYEILKVHEGDWKRGRATKTYTPNLTLAICTQMLNYLRQHVYTSKNGITIAKHTEAGEGKCSFFTHEFRDCCECTETVRTMVVTVSYSNERCKISAEIQ